MLFVTKVRGDSFFTMMKNNILLGFCVGVSLLTVSTTAFAQQEERASPAPAQKYRVSLGTFSVANTKTKLESKHRGTIKLDYVVKTLPRHDVLVSYQHLNDVKGTLSNASILTAEYQWRFGKDGRGYYGRHIGTLYNDSNKSIKRSSFSGNTFGYNLSPKSFVELCYSDITGKVNFTAIRIGKRF
jgi:hypothetical protein